MHKPVEHGDSAGRREGADALWLHHPNIATAGDRGECETLRQYLARVGRLPAFQGLALVTQLLSALAFAHRQGRVHGAIHPQRLLVSRSGQLKVAFDAQGAAAALATQPGASDASPYSAPEQRLGQPPDPRADLYAAAVVAYEVLTGALPLPAADEAATGQHERDAMPRAIRTLRPELPVTLDAVFQRALAPSPGARYSKAADLLDAFHVAFDPPMWERRPVACVVAVHERVADPPGPPASLPAAAPMLPPPAPALASGSPSRGLGLALVALVLAGSLFEGKPPAPGPDASGPVTVVEMHAGPAQPEPQGLAPQATAAPRTYPMTSPAKLTLPPPPPFASVSAAPAQPVKPPAGTPPEPAAAPAPPVERPRQLRPATTPQGSAALRSSPARAARRDAEPASKAKPPAAPVAKRAPAPSPSLGCSRGDSVIARQFCIALQCAKTEFRRHPVCVRIHAEQRKRNQLAEARGGP